MSIDNSSKEESRHHQDVKVKECLCGPNKRQQMADHNYSKRDGGERGRQFGYFRPYNSVRKRAAFRCPELGPKDLPSRRRREGDPEGPTRAKRLFPNELLRDE